MGREATISVHGLSPCLGSLCPPVNLGTPNVFDVSHDFSYNNVSNENNFSVNLEFESCTSFDSSESLISDDNLRDNSTESAYENVRRSSHSYKGVPPSRYGTNY